LRKPNYRQQKKTREDARKARQAKKQEQRQAPAKQPGEGADGQRESAPSTATDHIQD
jgi:hypothetical protein